MAPFSGCTVARGAGALDLLSCINRNGNAIMSQAAQSERPTGEGARGKRRTPWHASSGQQEQESPQLECAE